MSTIHRILHNIFFIYVLCHVCIYVIFVIFGYLFIGLIFISYMPCFPFLLLYLLMKFRLIIHMKCININYSSLWYILSMYFIVQISFSFKRFFKCFSLPFPSFMTILIGTQSHGSEKQ